MWFEGLKYLDCNSAVGLGMLCFTNKANATYRCMCLCQSSIFSGASDSLCLGESYSADYRNSADGKGEEQDEQEGEGQEEQGQEEQGQEGEVGRSS